MAMQLQNQSFWVFWAPCLLLNLSVVKHKRQTWIKLYFPWPFDTEFRLISSYAWLSASVCEIKSTTSWWALPSLYWSFWLLHFHLSSRCQITSTNYLTQAFISFMYIKKWTLDKLLLVKTAYKCFFFFVIVK